MITDRLPLKVVKSMLANHPNVKQVDSAIEHDTGVQHLLVLDTADVIHKIPYLSLDYNSYTLYPGFDDLLLKLNIALGFVKESTPSESTDWDKRKIRFVLGEINTWSKDPSTKVSAAIFNGKYPICSSYNGFPPGIVDTEERLNDRQLKYKIVQHAEANAITTCARLGIKTEGMSMAVSLFPCTTCAGMIIGAGITEVITLEPSEDAKSRWQEDFDLAKRLFNEAGVKVTIVNLDKV